jgi:hypothetical protein
LPATEIAREAVQIASEICIYTNDTITVVENWNTEQESEPVEEKNTENKAPGVDSRRKEAVHVIKFINTCGNRRKRLITYYWAGDAKRAVAIA